MRGGSERRGGRGLRSKSRVRRHPDADGPSEGPWEMRDDAIGTAWRTLEALQDGRKRNQPTVLPEAHGEQRAVGEHERAGVCGVVIEGEKERDSQCCTEARR